MLKTFIIPRPTPKPVTTKSFLIRIDNIDEEVFDVSGVENIGSIALVPKSMSRCEAEDSSNIIWTPVKYSDYEYEYDGYFYARVDYEPNYFSDTDEVYIMYTGDLDAHIAPATISTDMSFINDISYNSAYTLDAEEFAGNDIEIPINVGGTCWRIPNIQLDAEDIPDYVGVEYTVGNYSTSKPIKTKFMPNYDNTSDNIVGSIVIKVDNTATFGNTQDITEYQDPDDVSANNWDMTNNQFCETSDWGEYHITQGWLGSITIGNLDSDGDLVDWYYSNDSMVFGDIESHCQSVAKPAYNG